MHSGEWDSTSRVFLRLLNPWIPQKSAEFIRKSDSTANLISILKPSRTRGFFVAIKNGTNRQSQTVHHSAQTKVAIAIMVFSLRGSHFTPPCEGDADFDIAANVLPTLNISTKNQGCDHFIRSKSERLCMLAKYFRVWQLTT